MGTGFCKACGKKLKDSNLTHCSDECLMSVVGDSVSVYGNPTMNQDKEDDPWV